MKKIYYILVTLLIVSCYADEDEVITSEDVAHNTSQLTTMLKSISQHNATFDDHIDNTSCLSLEFPYQIYVNSELINVSSLNDIAAIQDEDDVDLIFPVISNFYNYQSFEAINQTDFNLIKNNCAENFNINLNSCLDIQYPLVIKNFNDLTENFETYQLNNDKEVYLHFDNLHDNDLYEIDYPIFLFQDETTSIRVDSNQEFMTIYESSLQNCN